MMSRPPLAFEMTLILMKRDESFPARQETGFLHRDGVPTGHQIVERHDFSEAADAAFHADEHKIGARATQTAPRRA